MKISKKWLSLGPRDPIGARNSQIWISTTFFCELNHSESFWAKKIFSKKMSKNDWVWKPLTTVRAVTFKNTRKKSQISVLTIYFHELDHSEWFKAIKKFSIFGSFKNFKNRTSPKISKKYVKKFFWTWKHSGMFLAL